MLIIIYFLYIFPRIWKMENICKNILNIQVYRDFQNLKSTFWRIFKISNPTRSDFNFPFRIASKSRFPTFVAGYTRDIYIYIFFFLDKKKDSKEEAERKEEEYSRTKKWIKSSATRGRSRGSRVRKWIIRGRGRKQRLGQTRGRGSSKRIESVGGLAGGEINAGRSFPMVEKKRRKESA